MEATIQVREGKASHPRIALGSGDRVVLGRTVRTGLRLDDRSVSRTHCIIENRGNLLLITDLGSSNGTWINDTRVDTGHLRSGDRVRVGLAELLVHIRDEAGVTIDSEAMSGSISKYDPLQKKARTRLGKGQAIHLQAALAKALTAPTVQTYKNLRALYQVSATLAEATEPEVVYETVCNSLIDLLPADRVAVLVVERHSGGHRVVEERRADGLQGSHPSPSRAVVHDTLLNNTVVVVQDTAREMRYLQASRSLVESDIQSVVAVPLKGRGGALGVIYLDSTRSPKAFDRDQIELVRALAHQAGLGVERLTLIDRLEALFIGAIRTLVTTIDAKDRYTYGHSERVAAYALALGRSIELDPADLEPLELAALLHDVGKIGVPEAVLNKPGKLSEQEFSTIRLHPREGARIIVNIQHPHIHTVAQAVLAHHERWDGRGYPRKLRGKGAPRLARILSLADAFDAMTSDRPYRAGFSHEEALRRIRENAGTQFDPELAGAFCELGDRNGLHTGSNSKYAMDPETERCAPLPASLSAVASLDPDEDEDEPTEIFDLDG